MLGIEEGIAFISVPNLFYLDLEIGLKHRVREAVISVFKSKNREVVDVEFVVAELGE